MAKIGSGINQLTIQNVNFLNGQMPRMYSENPLIRAICVKALIATFWRHLHTDGVWK